MNYDDMTRGDAIERCRVLEGENARGRTLRDYFAAKAMQALVEDSTLSDSEVVSLAYRLADEMLSEREK